MGSLEGDRWMDTSILPGAGQAASAFGRLAAVAQGLEACCQVQLAALARPPQGS